MNHFRGETAGQKVRFAPLTGRKGEAALVPHDASPRTPPIKTAVPYPFEVHGLFTVCPRYRYDAFAQSELRATVERLFAEACEHNGMTLLAAGVVSDHVHLLIRFNASLSPGSVMRLLKGRVSRAFSRQHPEVAREINGQGLWSRGYYYRRVSASAVPAVARYCHNQYDSDGVDKRRRRSN